MSQGRRLVGNAAITVLRMVATFGLGLLTTRLLFGGLGQSDFGLLNLAVAIAGFTAIAANPLAVAGERFLAFEAGRIGAAGEQRFYDAACSASAIVACTIALVGFAAAPLLAGLLVVPDERSASMVAALRWSFLAVAALALLAAPRSVLAARQEMGAWSLIDLLHATLRLAAVGLALALHGDRMSTVAALFAGGVLLLLVPTLLLVRSKAPALRLLPRWPEREDLRAFVRFAGGSGMGEAALQLQSNAGAALVNLGAGPAANAALAVATQLAAYPASLANAVSQPARAAIATAAGRGDSELHDQLVASSGKFAALALVAVMLPMLCEADTLLGAWLGSVPPHAPAMLVLLLMPRLAVAIAAGIESAILSEGRIVGYVLRGAVVALLALGVGVLLLPFGGRPPWTWPLVLAIAAALHLALVQLPAAQRACGLAIGRWWRRTAGPVALAALAGGLPALLASVAPIPDPWRLGLVALLAVSGVAAVTLTLGLEPAERAVIARIVAPHAAGFARWIARER